MIIVRYGGEKKLRDRNRVIMLINRVCTLLLFCSVALSACASPILCDFCTYTHIAIINVRVCVRYKVCITKLISIKE